MSEKIIIAFATKLSNHCRDNNIKNAYIAFHGGEPLLVEKNFYEFAVNTITTICDNANVEFVLQTNGTLLTIEWAELFKKLNIQVGVSIDGTKYYHDQYRIYHNTKGSFEDVIRGIKIRNSFCEGGLIAVINPKIPPTEFYNLMITLEGKYINILLPDNHYDSLPAEILDLTNPDETVYGTWMAELYNLWSTDNSSSRPRIPYFENIIALLLGFERGDELIGRRKNRAVTIESDGSIEVVDPLRICGNGFTRNNLNVLNNEISAIESSELFLEYYNSHENICATCLACPIKNVCGGGYLAHRFSNKNKFKNPSIYCRDIMKLTSHIQNDLLHKLPEEIIKRADLSPLSYNDLYNYNYNYKKEEHYEYSKRG